MTTNINWPAAINRAVSELDNIGRNLRPVQVFSKAQALWDEHKRVNAALFEQIEDSKSHEKTLDRTRQQARDDWEKLGAFKRLFSPTPDFTAMGEAVTAAGKTTSRLEEDAQNAWVNIQKDLQANLRADQRVTRNKEDQLLKDRCDALRLRLTAIQKASKKSVFAPPDGSLRDMTYQLPKDELLKMLEHDAQHLEHYIDKGQPRALTGFAAEKATEQILSAPIKLDVGENDDHDFANYRQRTLDNLKSMAPGQLTGHSLQSAIQTVRKPYLWQRVQQWLVFWTAMAVNGDIRRTSSESEGENVLAQRWVEKWVSRTNSWPDAVKNGLKCDPAFVYSSLLNTKGESESGADVMLALCSYTGSTCTVRLAYIQFKRTPPENRVASVKIVHSEIFDQYKLVASWHEPERGVTALYGMFSPKLGLLETVSAMDVVTVRQAINRKLGRNAESSADSWKKNDGRVEWTINAESMPTMLANALSLSCNGSPGFTSLDDVIEWMDGKLSGTNKASVQPSYWIFQTIGDFEITLDKALRNPGDEFHERVSQLAKIYGYQDYSHKHEWTGPTHGR